MDAFFFFVATLVSVFIPSVSFLARLLSAGSTGGQPGIVATVGPLPPAFVDNAAVLRKLFVANLITLQFHSGRN